MLKMDISLYCLTSIKTVVIWCGNDDIIESIVI